MRSGLNSDYFHIIGDKLINPIVGVLYTHYKDSLLKDPEPSRSKRIFWAPVPSEKKTGMDRGNPFLRTYLDS